MKPFRLDTAEGTLLDAHLFWNSSTKKRDDQAHHLGHGRWTPRAWRKHGQAYFSLFREHFGEDFTGRMLEWGCGGGANVVAFAEQFEHIVGVDISPDSLRRCAQACEEMVTKGYHFEPFPISIEDPFAARALKSEGNLFDFLLCIEVVQHMPSARYARDVMELWSELCWKGAGAMVQFRTHFRSRAAHRSPTVNYSDNVSRWLMLNPAVFADMAVSAGWEVVAMRGTGLTEFDPQRPTGYVDAFLRNMRA